MDEENKTVEQEMENLVDDKVVNDSPEDSKASTDQKQVEEAPPEAEADNSAEADTKPITTGSERLDKRLEKKPDINLDRIIDRLRDRSKYQAPSQESNAPTYQPLNYDDGGEYSPQQLAQDREAYANLRTQTGTREAVSIARTERQVERFADNLEYDLERVGDRYPELNPTSDEFNPSRASRLNSMFYNYIGYDEKAANIPERLNVRYRDFIDAMMGMAEDMASAKNADSAKNIARQASNTGLRPSGGTNRSPKLDNPEDIASMSREEYSKYKDKIQAKALDLLENME